MALIPWQATVQDDFGNIVPSPVVTVRNKSDDSLATIYDVDGVEIDNPLDGTVNGFVQFQVSPGRYTIEGAKGGSTTATWEFEAVDDGAYSTRALLVTDVAAGASWPDGTLISDGTVVYKAIAGATTISDLPGFVPHDPSGEYDCFPEHFVATGESTRTDITTALQAAINYAGAIGAGVFGQGGKIGLKAREYALSDQDADGYCCEIANSMTIEGAGPNITSLYITTTSETMFYVGAGDDAIMADTAGNSAVVDKVFFRGIQFFNLTGVSAPPTSGSFVEADRSVVELHDCRFINHFRAVEFFGNPESCRMINCDVTAGSNVYPTLAYDSQTGNFTVGSTLTGGTSGATATIYADTDIGATGTLTLSNVSGRFEDNEIITDAATGSATANGILTGKSGSCGVLIDRRQVNAAVPIAYQDSSDSLYYIEPNTITILGGNFRMGGASGYGGAYAVRIGACDLVDIKADHLAWGYTACVGIIPSQANIPLQDVKIAGGLIDPLPSKSLYGVYAADVGAVGSNTISSISVSGADISGAAEDGVRIVVDCKRIKLSDLTVKGSGGHGVIINDANAEAVTLDNVDVFNSDGNGDNKSAILIAAGDRVKVLGCDIDTGYRGIQLTKNPTRVMIANNTFDALDNESIFLPSGLTGEVTISGNDVDESHIIASASRVQIPVGLDYVHFTGTTDINEIRVDSPSSGYNGRRVLATFADALDIVDDATAPGGAVVPNLRIGSDFTTAGGTVVEFLYAPDVEAGKWVIASTRANS